MTQGFNSELSIRKLSYLDENHDKIQLCLPEHPLSGFPKF